MSSKTVGVDYAELAAQAAGNWRSFESFGWHDQPHDAENFTIIYTHNRDSRLLEESNAAAIDAELEPFREGDDPDVIAEHHGHWACGWVDGYAIRVFRQDGTITEAFQRLCDLNERLEDYPVLDDEDYSRREYEATLENIRSVGGRWVKSDAPDDWDKQVFSWFWDDEQEEVISRDDQGGYPSDEAMKRALLDLDFFEATWVVAVGDRIVFESESRKSAEFEFGTLVYHAEMGIGAEGPQESIHLFCDDETYETWRQE